MSMQSTAVIRQRGQITIPDKIRQSLSWVKTESIISILVTSKKELIIKPFVFKQVKKINWQEVWKRISRARSIKGKNGNLSEFIIQDRLRH